MPKAFKFKPNKKTTKGCGATSRNNGERAEGAALTLSNYKYEVLLERGPVTEDDVVDLLCDLLHLCDREHWDCLEAYRLANLAWKDER